MTGISFIAYDCYEKPNKDGPLISSTIFASIGEIIIDFLSFSFCAANHFFVIVLQQRSDVKTIAIGFIYSYKFVNLAYFIKLKTMH